MYDGLLLAGVLFLSALFFPLIPDSIEMSMAGRLFKVAYLLTVSFLFYGWFWTHGGQTLGMKAWNVYLIKPNGKFIDWRTAAVRYAVAVLSWAVAGLGFAWILLHPANRAWHDILSGSQIVYVPQPARPGTTKPGNVSNDPANH